MPKLVRDTIKSKVKTLADIIPALLGQPTPSSINAWRPGKMVDSPLMRGWEGPWHSEVGHLLVDTDRTARLREWDVPINNTSSVKPWEGSVSGQPYNVITSPTKSYDVHVMSRPIEFINGKLVPPIEKVPLPDVILRQGDPMGSSDMHMTVIDEYAEVVYDMILFDKNLKNLFGAPWKCGYDGGGAGLYVYDLSKPYSGQGGTCAASVPKFPLIIGYDEIERGFIDHTIFFSLSNYSPEKPTGWAQGTDGTWPGHPVRAGEILRLPARFIDRFKRGTPERVIAEALNRYGMFCGDKSTHGDPTNGKGSIVTTMDIRWESLKDMGLRLADFEVVVQG